MHERYETGLKPLRGKEAAGQWKTMERESKELWQQISHKSCLGTRSYGAERAKHLFLLCKRKTTEDVAFLRNKQQGTSNKDLLQA